MLLAAVRRAVEAAEVERALVACSGGIDSVVLADACVEILGRPNVVIGHVDHGVRACSAADAAFVREFAQALGVRCAIDRVHAGGDDEARLREARYEMLERQRATVGASHILVAHTREDQAETVLLGLVRSTRIAALAGMPAQRGRILRPILAVSRSHVHRYAARRRLKHRVDPSNVEPRYLRNRIRKELLPLLERRYRSGIGERLAALADELAHDRPSRTTPAVGGERLPSYPVPTVSLRRESWSGGPVGDGKTLAVFDADILALPVFRSIAPGDRIRPFGLRGTRKLQDVLVDHKVPRAVRSSLVVLADASGHVHWVPSLLRSDAALVTSATRAVWIGTSERATCGDAPDGSL